MDKISVRGARTHNLKNIDIDLPRDKLIVITGLSGSGKSSLAFDTIYAEGQRRYVESLSAYARQFLSMMEKPDIDHIEGLSPAISIEQKSTSHNPRSTVGTITEIYDYLRLLYARVGTPTCPNHDIPLDAQTVSQIVDQLLELKKDTKIMVLAPIVQERKGEHTQLIQQLRSQGFIRARLDGEVVELDDMPKTNPKQKHTLEVVVDRLKIRDGIQIRLAESIETSIGMADDLVRIAFIDGDQDDLLFSAKYACPHCGYSLSELEPKLFSFNSPAGACPTCDGLGSDMYFDPERIVKFDLSLADGAVRGWDRTTSYYFQMLQNLAAAYKFDLEKPFGKLAKKAQDAVLYGTGDKEIDFVFETDRGASISKRHPFEGIIPNFERRYRETDSNAVRDDLSKYISNRKCPTCSGSRLREAARHVFIEQKAIADLTSLNISRLTEFFETLELTGQRGQIAEKIVKEVNERLSFLCNVGLEYLTLNRSAETLSGGEAQRIRLASQIGAGLVGVMYVLDEPSIGLHQRDNQRLLNTLNRLRDLGNTVIVVEHDEDAIRAADHVVDIGPGAGVHGGQIIAQGTPKQIEKSKKSVTGDYLSGRRSIATPDSRTPVDKKRLLKLTGATGNNLKGVDIDIPLGLLTCITGVSGSGKSTLINDTVLKQLAKVLNQNSDAPAPFDKLDGVQQLDKVINIDQSPIGRTPRSNPATYTGLFTPIRELFSNTPEARSRGYKPGRFSFNVKGGRCEACQGDGVIKVEMHFLPDIYVPCDVCKGQRYNRETLDIRYKGKNIHEVLDMTVEDAHEFYKNIPVVERKLATLVDVGLSYIRLGQAATTLSGGEAQRIKLARELSKRPTGKTIYILDEPTTGLHFEDIAHLLEVLLKLRETGNSIVVIEHNLDVIKCADWIIDLGPEGGDGGGEIIAVGTPEQVAKKKRSYTGQFLKPLLTK